MCACMTHHRRQHMCMHDTPQTATYVHTPMAATLHGIVGDNILKGVSPLRAAGLVLPYQLEGQKPGQHALLDLPHPSGYCTATHLAGHHACIVPSCVCSVPACRPGNVQSQHVALGVFSPSMLPWECSVPACCPRSVQSQHVALRV